MLLNKKYTAVSFALAATMFVGCQTAQTKNSGPVADADLLIPDAYVMNDGAYRDLASGPGDFINELERGLSKAARGDEAFAKFVKQLDKSQDKEILEFKKTHGGKITKENANELEESVQKRFVEKFLNTKGVADLMKASEAAKKDLMALKSSVASDLKIGAKGALDSRGADKNAFKGVFGDVSQGKNAKTPTYGVSKTGTGATGKGMAGVHSEAVYDRLYSIYNKKYLVEMREASLKDPAIKAILEGPNGKAYEAAVDRYYKTLKEGHIIQGEAVGNIDACLLGDTEALNKVTDLIEEKNAAAKTYGKLEELKKDGVVMKNEKGEPIMVYRLCPEAAAVITANFQQELGRMGIAAWTAAEETCGPCKLCGPKGELEAAASRKLASTSHGEVPKVPEKCK
ncbi:MAG: hypothetical protein JST04_10145 [Bdellovibrionales bacterium]|nr:hypothetical protein [Bdellovibrionales bacterium]